MATPLLTTKLYIPPPRPNLVRRPRLIRRLDEGLRLGRRLTLVSAPAGYGKTTLLSEWLADFGLVSADDHTSDHCKSEFHPGWVSLDENDNDPARFLTYFVAALQQIDAGIGAGVQGALRAPQAPPVEALLTGLINDIAAAPASFVLVLDDYHAIIAPDIHRTIDLLIERQPPQMHLAIGTREDPPLALSRLRGRGQVTEIRQGDLRFTPEEAATFFNQSTDLRLSASDVEALDARTEGWIAGLQMASLALRGTLSTHNHDAESATRLIADFSGRHHVILDYLTDEVMDHQPAPIQTFLLQTSVLERLCGPLCDAVNGKEQICKPVLSEAEGSTNQQMAGELVPLSPPFADSSGQEVLEYLERANLFVVPLDGRREWYRYHRLFAELLRARLREAEPDRVPELHRRAAAWYDRNGLASEAVHHALAAEDFDLAAGIIERAIQEIATWTSVDVATLLGWWNVLPDEATRARPWLRLFASRALYVTGRREAAERVLGQLEESLRDHPTAPGAGRMSDLIAADRASYAVVRGDVRQAIDFAHQALSRLPEDDATGRIRAAAILGLARLRAGDVSEAGQAFSQAIAAASAAGIDFTAVPLVCNLADVQIVQGQLRQAIQTCEQAMEMGIVDGARTPATGFAGLQLGKILYKRNDLESAQRSVSQGLELLRRGGFPDGFGLGNAVLARIRQAGGDEEGARAAIQQALQITQGFNVPRASVLVSAYQARIWLAQGNVDLAVRWARDYRRIGATEYLREFEELTLARVLLAQGKPAAALDVLEVLLDPAEEAGRLGRVIEIQALRALALHAQGETAAGPAPSDPLDALERALGLAEPEGYVRVFIDEGEPMVRLLRQAVSRHIVSEYASKLLAEFGSQANLKPGTRLLEPLTDREMEVLQLLAEGLSNPEIARRLFIALPTVKSHTRNIYRKLDIHTRKQAVAQAQALGILPPETPS